MQIEIEKYSIKSTGCCAGLGHIKNWVLEVSNDKNKWIKIDEQTNYSELNDLIKSKHLRFNQTVIHDTVEFVIQEIIGELITECTFRFAL